MLKCPIDLKRWHDSVTVRFNLESVALAVPVRLFNLFAIMKIIVIFGVVIP